MCGRDEQTIHAVMYELLPRGRKGLRFLTDFHFSLPVPRHHGEDD
jgi:hypothetical protein